MSALNSQNILLQLMILPKELSVYYYQSLMCHLNNYTTESKTLLSLDELKTLLTGNKFIVYINDVEEIRLVFVKLTFSGSSVTIGLAPADYGQSPLSVISHLFN